MDELLSRSAPHSLEAEQAVIGSMLLDSSRIPFVLDKLKPEQFFYQQNRELFEVIQRMFNYAIVIDALTVVDQLRQQGLYHEGQSYEYVAGLLEVTPTAANVAQYVEIVRDKALLRSLGEAAAEIGELVRLQEGTAEQILDASEKKIYGVRTGRNAGSLEHIGTILSSLYQHLVERSKIQSEIAGLSTGLRDLDLRLSGLNNSDLIILAARPGVGKTSLALNIALSVAKTSKKAVAFFSLEMGKEQLAMRLLSSQAGIEHSRLRTAQLSEQDWNNITIAAEAIRSTEILVDDSAAITVSEMNARCRRLQNLGLVVIDYIQLMSGSESRGESRVQVVSELSRNMKIMAKELNVPIICLSQLSRDSEKAARRPRLSDLRESGSIEQDADVVMFLYREAQEEDAAALSSEVECIVAKNRHGEPGTVTLQWLPGLTSFADRSWAHGDEDE